MVIRSKILARALFELVADEGRDPEVVAKDFSSFVAQYGLFDQVPRIVAYLEDFWALRKQEGMFLVSAPMDLKDELIERIRQYAGVPKEAETMKIIDKNLIGGFVAQYRGTRYDASVKKQLARLREELVAAPVA